MEPEEPAWKTILRERVAGACGCLRNAGEHLKRVEAFFASPAYSVAVLYQNHCSAMESLKAASQNLEFAVAQTQAAEILALHGCNANDPSVPLPSAEPLAQAEPSVHAAITSLRTCGARAENASKFAEWCRGYLATAIALLDKPGIPGHLGVAAREFSTACAALTNTMRATQAALHEAKLANQILEL